MDKAGTARLQAGRVMRAEPGQAVFSNPQAEYRLSSLAANPYLEPEPLPAFRERVG